MTASRFEVSRVADGVLRLKFEPAGRSGALDTEALAALAEAAARAGADPDARLVLLEGAREDLFAAGAHLDEVASLDESSAFAFADAGRAAIAAWEELAATTVAVVRGACHGGAVDLVLASDLVVAFPGATIAHPGVKRGIVTGWGGTVRARGRLTRGSLLELFLPGEPIGAERALANGLVDVIARDEADLAALVERWAGAEGEALRRLKSLTRDVEGLTAEQALLVEERSRELEERGRS